MDSRVGAGRITLSYVVGIAVGAGFVIGKGVFVFFTRYGAWGNTGIIIEKSYFSLYFCIE
ncbi:hypothetical protein [Pasteuria penetrans]|uniref:hypothetical protein n=1 Tax=Pasteuria penetrans TaxID=86005 RepID=UPI000F9C2AAD|nr:hypothetical protein [Pasteuria penetrans]